MDEEDNPTIWKEAVVGFLIVRSKKPNQDSRGSHYVVHMAPLIADWQFGDFPHSPDTSRLDADLEIVGIIPSPAGSAAVLGRVPKNPGGVQILGYEIPGSTAQGDWEVERQRAIKASENAEKDNTEQDARDATRNYDREV